MNEEEKKHVMRREISLAKNANEIICVSEREKFYFNKYGVHNVNVISTILEDHFPLPKNIERVGLLFVGNIRPDTPNEDSMIYFLSEIFPLILKKIDISIDIVGICKSSKILQFRSPNVKIHGMVSEEDLSMHFLSHKVFVIPTRYSGGIPLKYIEAGKYKIPSVVTPSIAEQIGINDFPIYEVGKTPKEFAKKVINLCQNDTRWRIISDNAGAYVEKMSTDHSDRLKSIINKYAKTPPPKKRMLSNVTLIGIDCVDLHRIEKSVNICQEFFEFAEVKILSSISSNNSNVIKIENIPSTEGYSEFCIKHLADYIDTDYVLVVQFDGFILNPDAWSDDFLSYDYLGAPWSDKLIGNGGFSMRSKKLMKLIQKNYHNLEGNHHPEDVFICVHAKKFLETNGIVFAPVSVAHRFSHEGWITGSKKWNKEFGFHDFRITDIRQWTEKNKKWRISQPQKHKDK